jgi:hypothetical protein
LDALATIALNIHFKYTELLCHGNSEVVQQTCLVCVGGLATVWLCAERDRFVVPTEPFSSLGGVMLERLAAGEVCFLFTAWRLFTVPADKENFVPVT